MAGKRIFLTLGAVFMIYAVIGTGYCISENYSEMGMDSLSLCPLEIILGIAGLVLVVLCRGSAKEYFRDRILRHKVLLAWTVFHFIILLLVLKAVFINDELGACIFLAEYEPCLWGVNIVIWIFWAVRDSYTRQAKE